MNNGFLAESAHIETLDPAFEDMPILRKRADRQVETVMSNSFGFGGTNGCLIMARPPQDDGRGGPQTFFVMVRSAREGASRTTHGQGTPHGRRLHLPQGRTDEGQEGPDHRRAANAHGTDHGTAGSGPERHNRTTGMNQSVITAIFATGLAAAGWVGWGFIGHSPLALAMTVMIAATYLLGVWALNDTTGQQE
eukprot:gene61283-83820_t